MVNVYTLLNPEAFPRKFVDQVETRAKRRREAIFFRSCSDLLGTPTRLNLENRTQFSGTSMFRPNRGVCSLGGGGGGGKELFWESGLTPLSKLWSGPCAARGMVVCLVAGGGIFFVRVVWLLCQTSDQVPVLQEIMKVVMDTQRMLVNLSGWLKTVKGNVAFVKVWKCIVIHDLPASGGGGGGGWLVIQGACAL